MKGVRIPGRFSYHQDAELERRLGRGYGCGFQEEGEAGGRKCGVKKGAQPASPRQREGSFGNAPKEKVPKSSLEGQEKERATGKMQFSEGRPGPQWSASSDRKVK